MNAHVSTPPAPAASQVTPLRIRPADEARLIDVMARASQRGLTLVTDGHDIYLTPIVMPGEFRVGVAMREAA